MLLGSPRPIVIQRTNRNQNMKVWIRDASFFSVGLMYRKITNHAIRDKVFLNKFFCQFDVLL